LLLCPAHASAERPLTTEGLDILKEGQVAIELGAEYLEDQRLPFDTSGIRGREELAIPQLGFAVGLGDRVEVQGDFDVFYMDESGRDDTYDVGDFRLWTKIRMYEEGETHPGIGIRFGVKLPNASNESRLGTDETDFMGDVILTQGLGPIEARFNVGLGILGNPNVGNTQDDVLRYGAGLLYPFEGTKFTLIAEIFGQGASNESNDYSSVRTGLIIDLTEDLTFDVSGRAGITDESEDYGAGAGITWKFMAFNN